jgi:hypothetical protein
MVALNLLSLVLSWIARSYALNGIGSVMVVLFAAGNAALGTYLAWRLMQS